jgi:hypothetical protein
MVSFTSSVKKNQLHLKVAMKKSFNGIYQHLVVGRHTHFKIHGYHQGKQHI